MVCNSFKKSLDSGSTSSISSDQSCAVSPNKGIDLDSGSSGTVTGLYARYPNKMKYAIPTSTRSYEEGQDSINKCTHYCQQHLASNTLNPTHNSFITKEKVIYRVHICGTNCQAQDSHENGNLYSWIRTGSCTLLPLENLQICPF